MKKINLLIVGLFLLTNLIIAQSPLNSLNFDGADDYVSSSLPTVFNDIDNNDITIEAWINPGNINFSRVVYAQLDANNFVALSISNNLIFFYVSNMASQKTLEECLTVGVWSHVACTWDASTSQIEIYVDGVLKSTLGGGSSSIGSNNLMCIGARPDGNQFFQGELDEVRIWDVIRSPCEIATSVSSEYTELPENLVAYYNFNEGIPGESNTAATSLPDFTGNYDGILLNFGLTGSSSNWVSSSAGITDINQFNDFYTLTDEIMACKSYTWIDGIEYTSSNNTATHYIDNSGNSRCDSLITLNLTISPTETTTSLMDETISVDQERTAYQWLDCDNEYSPIDGATDASYTAIKNGNYAVQVIENGCLDTTACVNINTIFIACDAFDRLSEIVIDLNLTSSVERGLLNKIKYAKTYFKRGYARRTEAYLNSFINQVNGQTGRQITEEEAAVLIGIAEAIITSMEDGIDPCEPGVQNRDYTFDESIVFNDAIKMNIYPNPIDNYLNILFEREHEEIAISVIRLDGKVVYSETHLNTNLVNVIMENEPAGIYFLNVKTGSNSEMHKVLKL